MVNELLSGSDQGRARDFLVAQGLAWEPGFDNLVGVFDGPALVAVGARAANVLKMIAIAPSQQSGPLLGEVVGALVRAGLAAGHESLFVFTRPAYAQSFEALNFSLLAAQGQAVLLEYGAALARTLERWRPLVRPGDNGAVVVNCNPFTLGHRHLIEQAAARVDRLYVFVVREDRSVFPFAARLQMVREGTRDLANVTVLDTDAYAVSAITFPSYFLKATDPVALIQMELDLALFARHLAPFFHIRHRYFGQEPSCATTRAYNQAMLRILPLRGLEAIELPRLRAGGEVISASRVRAALERGDLTGLGRLLPPATLDYLQSPGGLAVRERLRTQTRTTA